MGKRIKDLATRATKLITGNTWLVADNGTVVEKIDYKELAKQIIEEYNTSNLAGSAQSIQAALTVVNNHLTNATSGFFPETVTDLNSFYDNMESNRASYCRYAQNCSNAPRNGNGSGLCMTYKISANYGMQYAYDDVWTYYRGRANGVWGEWEKTPTQQSITAMTNNTYGLSASVAIDIPMNADLNTYTTPGNFKCANKDIANSLVNAPSSYNINQSFSMKVENTSGAGSVIQTITVPTRPFMIFKRIGIISSGTWIFDKWDMSGYTGMHNLLVNKSGTEFDVGSGFRGIVITMDTGATFISETMVLTSTAGTLIKKDVLVGSDISIEQETTGKFKIVFPGTHSLRVLIVRISGSINAVTVPE